MKAACEFNSASLLLQKLLYIYNERLMSTIYNNSRRCCLSVECQSQGTVTSWSSSSVGVYVTSSSNNDVISGESSTTDMAAGATGGNEGPSAAAAATAATTGRRFRLLPSLHNVLFPGYRRQRTPSTGKQ